MSETLHVDRIGRTLVTAVELVDSPDDGGYYLGNSDFRSHRRRVSQRIYKSADEARADWNAGTVVWED